MPRNLAYALIVVALVLGAVGGVLVYTWTVGGSGEPSNPDEPISAPTLSLDTVTEEAPDLGATGVAQVSADLAALATSVADNSAQLAEVATQVQAVAESLPDTGPLATSIAGVSAQLDTMMAMQSSSLSATPVILVVTRTPSQPDPTLTPTVPPPSSTPIPTNTPTALPTATSTPIPAFLFRINQEKSQVRFILNEVLQGNPTTVIGMTNLVAGDIIVNLADPSQSQIGPIRINARDLRTDNEFRNRAIRGQILQSSRDEYEFIDFTPTTLQDLPSEPAAIGDTLTFTVTGDLRVRNIVQSVTFEVTATVTAENRLEGTAFTTVLRSDYDLQIPNVPGVADVTDEVRLEIDFVADIVEG